MIIFFSLAGLILCGLSFLLWRRGGGGGLSHAALCGLGLLALLSVAAVFFWKALLTGLAVAFVVALALLVLFHITAASAALFSAAVLITLLIVCPWFISKLSSALLYGQSTSFGQGFNFAAINLDNPAHALWLAAGILSVLAIVKLNRSGGNIK